MPIVLISTAAEATFVSQVDCTGSGETGIPQERYQGEAVAHGGSSEEGDADPVIEGGK